MRLVYVFTAILAITFAEKFEDSIAAESIQQKEGADLKLAASSYDYIPPSQRPSQWNQQNYVPQNTWNPPEQNPVQPVNTNVQSPSPIIPPENDYVYQINNPGSQPHTYYPPTWWTPTTQKPTTWWTPTTQKPTTSTAPVAVIKNELYYGDNGSYKYEYQIADGTHVGEEGYFTDPKQTEESSVKKGWYSFTDPNGKVYTVTYWADKTGFHAYGDHLPTPPPVPPAIQAALDQKAKDEAEQNKPQVYPTYNPTQKPIYQTTSPIYYPPQQTYYPQEQNFGGYGKK